MPIMARPILILEPVLLPVIFSDAKENQMQCSVLWSGQCPLLAPIVLAGLALTCLNTRGAILCRIAAAVNLAKTRERESY
ncbi:hypothetical protein LSTR_LSTR014036 [Laodelphax striatellus]|uniref:Uncharacterized protein n=1 Tax=Laodelphax striatellus TaxID=195883 RepID=A0A482X587_LAOST|nr:hypothetical protein LSTR_LSTR014036 [Laodelphax striatellus]